MVVRALNGIDRLIEQSVVQVRFTIILPISPRSLHTTVVLKLFVDRTQILRCSTHTQHLWRQKLCCYRATYVFASCNSLPVRLRDENIISYSFRRELKTF